MNVTINLDENVDISFIKKVLLQIKGVKSIVVNDENILIKEAIQKSRDQIKNGNSKEYSEELLDSVFNKK